MTKSASIVHLQELCIRQRISGLT